MKKYIFILAVIIISYNASYSQQSVSRTDSLNISSSLTNGINNQKTANSQDILSNIFRTSITNLLGKSKSFQFNTTLYGLDSFFNKNNRSNVDTLYRKQKSARNIQINLSVKADSNSNKIASFSVGATIAVINKRNITTSDFSSIIAKFKTLEKLRKNINIQIAAKNPGIISELQDSWSKYDISHDYKDLDSHIIEALEKRSTAEKLFLQRDSIHIEYQRITAINAEKPLLTIAPNYAYNRISKQSAFSVNASFLDGIGNPVNRKPWELEAKASLSIEGDSTIIEPNYNNKPFTISVGINKVLRQDNNRASTLELKGFFEYNEQLGNVSSENVAGKVTFNSTLRVKLYKSIWLPLTLSYDVKHSNILGFLSLTANID